MKTLTLILLLSTLTKSLCDDQTDWLRLAMLLRDQDIQAARQSNPTMSSIYQAYPNNPSLYRYLQDNPRYIPFYLGGQISTKP